MIREFWLEDENGNKYLLSDIRTCIAHNVTNLGIESTFTYFEYPNSYVTATAKMPIVKPTMDLVFIEGYKGYADFLSFISKAKELKLYYRNIEAKYCIVDIERLSKGDLISNNSLNCQIVFNKKTMWMIEYAVSISTEETGGYKTYDYTYDYKYIDVVNGEILIKNRGSVPAPVNIEIKGNLINPLIQILVEDKVVSECKLNINYEKAVLTITSEEGKESMYVTTPSEEKINVYQKQDFTKQGFLFVPVSSSKIRIIPGGLGAFFYKVVFHELYRGN